MVDIKNIPAELKTSCCFCVWKFEKRNGQKTKMPYTPANGDRARINDLRTFRISRPRLLPTRWAAMTASALLWEVVSELSISTIVSVRTVH